MKFTTPVGLPPKAFDVMPESRLAFFGSCFAERIALRMKHSGLRATANPMGTLYNPASIALAVSACLHGEVHDDWLYEGVEGLWHSRLHSTAFSAPSCEECLRMVENSIAQGKEMLECADALIVTFGTADVYEHRGKVVANCHRQPARQFLHRRLTIDEIVDQWKALLTEIWSRRSNLKVVMTVSPYRYAGLGMHESTLSKATLHLAIEQLQQWDRRIAYFPAYEIVLDELRDYRFYAPDMLHVSEQASDFVWKRFVAWCFAPEAVAHMEEWSHICKDLSHRPLRPQSEEYAKFRQRAEQRCADFTRKWGINPAEALPQFN